MSVRRATIKDAAAIADVHVRSWQSAYKGILPEGFLSNLNKQSRKEMWSTFIKNDGKLYVLEKSLCGIFGFLSLERARDSDLTDAIELSSIYLHPKHYNRGAGSAFWREVEPTIRASCVYLWVLSRNERGKAFYLKNGFTPDGVKKSFRIGNQDFQESRFTKQLSTTAGL